MIFLTCGSLKGFDRLVRSVDDLVATGRIDESVQAQIGPGDYQPRHFPSVAFLPQDEFRDRISEASLVIAHVGVGTILLAGEAGVPVIALPRLARLGEHVNDHQTDTAESMEADGICLIAWKEDQLLQKIEESRNWKPRQGDRDQRLVDALRRDILALGDRRACKLRKRLGRHAKSS